MVSASEFIAEKVALNSGNSYYSFQDLGGDNSSEVEKNILADTRAEISRFYDVFSPNIASYRYDLMFLYLDQWDPNLRSIRKQKRKTVLTINYLRSMIQRLVGQEGETDPDLVVSPPDDYDVDEKETMLKEGILRQAMYEQNFKVTKNEAIKYALSAGYSAILGSYERISPNTYNKRLTWRHIKDATTCFWDADAKEIDKSDSEICGFFTSMDKAEFHLTFPHAKSDLSFNTLGNSDQVRNEWLDGDKIRIADVWRKEKYTDTIVLLSNGESMPKDKAEEYLKDQDSLIRKMRAMSRQGSIVPPQLMQKVTIEEEEERLCYKIVHYQMIPDELLNWNDWPSDLMSLVFVDCESTVIDGIQRTQSYHAIMQDRQRQLNYMASAECDATTQSHQGNWLGTPDNFRGNVMKTWLMPQTPNGILIANRDASGQLPTYTAPPQVSQSFASQQEAAIRDIYSISGYRDANGTGPGMGRESGEAVTRREASGNLPSFKPFQNLELAIEQCGRIGLSLMPAVFDNTRTVSIRTKDGKNLKQYLNEPSKDEFGEDSYKNDMSRQGFSVKLEAGASFAAQRQVMYNTLMQFVQAAPQLAPLIYDRVLENMDIDNVKQMVDRVQKYLVGTPVPQIISEETGIPIPKQPPNPEAMMAMQKAQLEQKKVQNESDKIALQSQQMVQDAVNDHARDVIDVQKFNAQLQADHIKSQAELERAKIDSHQKNSISANAQHVDLFKHLNPNNYKEEKRKHL